MFCGQQVPFSETWPASGTTLGGRLYPLPKPAPPTSAGGCSSSPGLLPTPRAADGMNSTMEANRERMDRNRSAGARAWRGTIEEAVSLLKTPTAQLAVNGGSQQPGKRREGGHGPTLADQVEHELLPTPAARDWKSGQSNIMDRNARPLNEVIVSLLPTPNATDCQGGPRALPGLSRNAQLKALGKGVVPQQAVLALRLLLAGTGAERAA
jgi:hypothetical protein